MRSNNRNNKRKWDVLKDGRCAHEHTTHPNRVQASGKKHEKSERGAKRKGQMWKAQMKRPLRIRQTTNTHSTLVQLDVNGIWMEHATHITSNCTRNKWISIYGNASFKTDNLPLRIVLSVRVCKCVCMYGAVRMCVIVWDGGYKIIKHKLFSSFVRLRLVPISFIRIRSKKNRITVVCSRFSPLCTAAAVAVVVGAGCCCWYTARTNIWMAAHIEPTDSHT